jgi:hypothetical protein
MIEPTPSLSRLSDAFGGYWLGEHPEYPKSYWRSLVTTGHTFDGYWETIAAEIYAGNIAAPKNT